MSLKDMGMNYFGKFQVILEGATIDVQANMLQGGLSYWRKA